MTNTAILRSFASSAQARAAGYSTLEWLRAFSIAEHAARIEVSHAITDREMEG
jgi:hypothetical protein